MDKLKRLKNNAYRKKKTIPTKNKRANRGGLLMCNCQKCGNEYNIDLLIPDDIWIKISPKKSDAGLLCPNCICEEIDNMKIGTVNAVIFGRNKKNE